MVALLSIATLLLPLVTVSATPVPGGVDHATSTGPAESKVTPGYDAFAKAHKKVTATLTADNRDIKVHGVSASGVDAYLGIPFAAPRECLTPPPTDAQP